MKAGARMKAGAKDWTAHLRGKGSRPSGITDEGGGRQAKRIDIQTYALPLLLPSPLSPAWYPKGGGGPAGVSKGSDSGGKGFLSTRGPSLSLSLPNHNIHGMD